MAYMERKNRPPANFIVQEKYQDQIRKIEAKKLASVKATINTQPVPKPTHVRRNAKKEMMMEGQ